MKYLLATLLAFVAISLSAQDTQRGRIKKISQVETEKESGLNTSMETEYKLFDERGNLLEHKEMSLKGKLKLWVKYRYNDDNKVIQEEILNESGEVVEKTVTTWKAGQKVTREYYDHKDRLIKVKEYRYEYYPVEP